MNEPLSRASERLLYYQGQLFDRPSVLQFILSVEDDYAWLRSDLDLWFPTCDGHGRYKPDLLIRDWRTGHAELIQIAPVGFDDFEFLARLQKMVRLYCLNYHLDWHLRVVFEEHIELPEETQSRYEQLINDSRSRILEFSAVLYQNDSGFTDFEFDSFVRYGEFPKRK